MFEDGIRISGKRIGRTSVILAGVHGDEHCGIKALEELTPSLEIECGEVVFAYGNPRAIEKNVRFTEANLNRMFDESSVSTQERASYEYQRAQYLKKLFNKADALLDIHSTSVSESEHFVICEANANKHVSYLPVPLIVSGFDVVEPGGTDYYMNSRGKVGICIECGSHNSPDGVAIARKSIYAFLKTQGHISGNLIELQKKYVRMFLKYYAKTDCFKLTRLFNNFEQLTAGELIGYDGIAAVRAPRDCCILFAHNGNVVGDEVFLLGEFKKGFM